MKYDTRISGWGECALEFLNEDCNFLIIFNETAPQELADISVLHTVAMLQEEPCVGDTVQICDVSYTITAIGFEALHTLKELGHCCLSFSGSTQALRPGNIELKGPVFTEKIILNFKESVNNWYMFRLFFHMGSDKDIK